MNNLFKKFKEGKSKRSILLKSAVFLSIVFLSLIFALYSYLSSHKSTDDAFIEGHAISISPKISGHILKVYVDDNQQVNKGEILSEIDPRDYETRFEMAQSTMMILPSIPSFRYWQS